jgi:hypothetical protein
MWSSRVTAAVGVLTATAAVAIATTVAGGETTGSATPAPGRPSVPQGEKAAREALAAWDRFPAGAQARPLVIPVGPGIINAPRDQREDLAIYHARWALAAPRATDVAVARHRHWISSAAAIAALRDDLQPAPTPSTTLTVRARLGRASFVTDRGKADLPAWQFSFGRFREPASVLAPVAYKAPPVRRLDPDGVGNSEDGEQAVISADGRGLKLFFIGGPAGAQPCDDNYSATAAESNRAVAFTIYEHPAPTPPNLGCALVGYQRTVVVRLNRPLGARVLVDSTDGGAIPVARKPTFR